jgi:hypothetical protein
MFSTKISKDHITAQRVMMHSCSTSGYLGDTLETDLYLLKSLQELLGNFLALV